MRLLESDTTERLHFPFSLSCIGEGNGNPLQCSCLENPRDGKPGRLPSMGSHRVRHDWSDLAVSSSVTYELWKNGTVVIHHAFAAAAVSRQSCPTLYDPIDGSPPGLPSLGFSRQEHWSGLPFPSPMHENEKWKWSRSVVSYSSDPMDCSLPGSSVHGIFQAKVLEWIAYNFYL